MHYFPISGGMYLFLGISLSTTILSVSLLIVFDEVFEI